MHDPVKFLHDLSAAAIAAADPLLILSRYLPEKPKGRILVIGAGKASAQMARAVENAWPEQKLEGIVITRYGFVDVPCQNIEIVEASHPVPDASGEDACGRILDKLDNLSANDLLLCLISGGGSALLSYPAPCLTSEEKREINAALLRSGAPIHDMNCLRKHLSAVKGGQLALAAHPAKVLSLIISDVPGDNPATVASGPTVPDPTTQSEALAVIEKYNIPVSDQIRKWLTDPANETPKMGDPRFENCDLHIIANCQDAIHAAEHYAAEHDVLCVDLGDDLEGEARSLAHAQIHSVLEINPDRPKLFLSGGETTVTMKGSGKGGRNTEFILAAAMAAQGAENIYGIAVDTDGIDGSEDNAGAFFTPDTLAKAKAKNLDAADFLKNNDSYSFFEAVGGLVKTGPTYTNVNDFRALLVLPKPAGSTI